MDIGHWQYPDEIDITLWFGFIYRVIDNTNDMHYIGKKQFWATKRKTVKGRKNKKVIKSESNWKTYTSSSDHLNAAIIEKGKENFTFLIESLHETKGSLHYAEVESQIYEDVLRSTLKTGNRKYYNKMVANIRFIPPNETAKELNHKIHKFEKVKSKNNEHTKLKSLDPKERDSWYKKYQI